MKFNERLNDYLDLIDANQKELAEETSLSRATISRFCQGKREPYGDSGDLAAIAQAITSIAKRKDIPIPSYDDVYQSLFDCLEELVHVDYSIFLENLNYLLKYLGVKNTELAEGIYRDVSHLSRILSGESHPRNRDAFIHDIASYLAFRYNNSSDLSFIAKLLEVNAEDIKTSAALRDELIRYLGSQPNVKVDDSLPHFLSALDDFDLKDYLKAVHFDDIKVPPAMPHLPTRKEYTGIQKMMESELDFMKTTVLSRSMEDCILYSDMPLEEMASDPEFPKKYLFGMAMMLKKGLHLHVIHDVNRPFPEMMLGLESFIPLYMTGQISPYYLPVNPQNRVFLHFLKVSGAAALEGTAISGDQGSGKYVLYRSKEDVKHYRNRAFQLLSKASPLIRIYQKENAVAFHALQKELFADTPLKMICSHFPVYLLPEGLLADILKGRQMKKEEIEEILKYHSSSQKAFFSLLEDHSVHLVVPEIDEDRFSEYMVSLALSELFSDTPFALKYDEYTKIMDHLRQLEKDESNLKLECNPSPAFHNINIQIIGKRAVIVSKEKGPGIHFVIYHKKMIQAFQNFIPPVVDE